MSSGSNNSDARNNKVKILETLTKSVKEQDIFLVLSLKDIYLYDISHISYKTTGNRCKTIKY